MGYGATSVPNLQCNAPTPNPVQRHGHTWNEHYTFCLECKMGYDKYINLIPNEKYTASQMIFEIKCECGVEYVRDGGMHSSWCPKYTKE